jgi:hypothetical protein
MWPFMVKNKTIKSIESQIDFWEDAKSYVDIRNCVFGFKCHQTWEALLKRKEKNIKYCLECEKEVYLIENNSELMHAIKFNHCVAIKLRHDEIPQTKKTNITVGMLTTPNYDEPAYLRNKK